MIIKGFSFGKAFEAFVIAESTIFLICGVALGLIAIPALIVVYYGVCNYLTPVDKSERWIKPFLNATFFALLYGLFRLVYENLPKTGNGGDNEKDTINLQFLRD